MSTNYKDGRKQGIYVALLGKFHIHMGNKGKLLIILFSAVSFHNLYLISFTLVTAETCVGI